MMPTTLKRHNSPEVTLVLRIWVKICRDKRSLRIGEKIGARCQWVSRIEPMSAPYDQLIDATIRHLEDLKARGTRFVPVAPETISLLKQTAPAPTQTRSASAEALTRPAVSTAPAATPPQPMPKPPLVKPSVPLSVPTPETIPGSAPAPAAQALDPQAKAEAFRELRE